MLTCSLHNIRRTKALIQNVHFHLVKWSYRIWPTSPIIFFSPRHCISTANDHGPSIVYVIVFYSIKENYALKLLNRIIMNLDIWSKCDDCLVQFTEICTEMKKILKFLQKLRKKVFLCELTLTWSRIIIFQ